MFGKKKTPSTPPEIAYYGSLGQRMPDEFAPIYRDVLTWLIDYAINSPDQVWDLTDGHGLDEATREDMMAAIYARLDKLPSTQKYSFDRSLI